MRPAEEQFVAMSRRCATLGRTLVVLLAQLVCLPAVPPGHRRWALAALAVSIAWHAVLLTGVRRPLPGRLILADTAFLGALLAAQPLVDVPSLVHEGAGWAQMLAMTAVVAHPWQFPRAPVAERIAVALVVAVAFGMGATAAIGFDAGTVLEPSVWLVTVAGLSGLLAAMLRSAARRVDDAGAAHERQTARAELARARREATQEHLAALHDTAAATLTMVGIGAVTAGDPRLRTQAERDLQVLAAQASAADLGTALDEVVAQSGVAVEWSGESTGSGALPPEVVTALAGAVREALLNAERHGAGRGARLTVRRPGGRVEIEVGELKTLIRDDDPPPSPLPPGAGPPIGAGAGRGVRWSIIERMRRAGGTGEVVAADGGVRVRLSWSPATAGGPAAAMPDEPRAGGILTAATLLRRFRAGLLIVLTVLLFRAAATDLSDRWAVQLPAFAVLTVAAVATARLRDEAWRWPLFGLVVAAGAVITATIPAAQLLGAEHTTWRVIGWYAGVLWVGESMLRVTAPLGAAMGVLFVQFALAGRLDRTGVALFAMAIMVNVGCQLTFALATRLLRNAADRADQLAEEDARSRTAALVADQLQGDRVERYRDVAETVVPLLEGLRSGELSPADPAVRQRSSVEAARLRRLMAEGDEVSDPLVHELRACVDAAQRAGVRVDVAVRGQLGRTPVLTVRERRRLTEPVIEVLFRARSRARVILIAQPRDVSVSIVADVLDDEDPGAYGPGPEVVRDGERLWVTSRWPETAEV